MCDHFANRAVGPVLAMLLSMVCMPEQPFSQGLISAEQDGYLIWLHALESTIASREAAGLPEEGRLYPFGIEDVPGSQKLYLFDVARSLVELESRPRLLQEPTPASALHALTRARNYASLAEYDSALVWYEIAAQRDAQGELAADMGRDKMAAAIAVRCAQTVRTHMQELLHLSGSEEREPELELAYRFFLATRDTAHLNMLIDKIDPRSVAHSGRIVYWQAFSLNWLGRWSESLDLLKGLVVSDGHSHGLSEAQRAWVLTAIADQMFLTGARDTAAPLYRALAASTLGEAAVWAACQVAAFDLLESRFLEAGAALERLCHQKTNKTWKQYACRLADLSNDLERLRNEGRSYGADVHYQP